MPIMENFPTKPLGSSSSYDIVGGEYIRNKDDGSEQRMKIRRRHTHPDYDNNNVDNDVCVLEVILLNNSMICLVFI